MEAIWQTVESIWANSLVKAAVYLLLAFIVAFAVSFAVKRLCRLLKINEKLGDVKDGEGKHDTAVGFIGKLTYLIVFLLFLPTVLGHLGLGEVSDSIGEFTGGLIEFIPRLIVAVIILAVGIFAAGILEALLRAALKKIKLDNLAARIMPCGKIKFSIINVLSVTLRVVIILFAVAESVKVLGLAVLSGVTDTVVAYLPMLIKAIIIGILAYLGAAIASSFLTETFSGLKWLTGMIKAVVYTVAAFMILSQLGFAPEIVNLAFVIILGAVALAMAIAVGVSFGVGGRSFAEKTLNKLDSAVCNQSNPTDLSSSKNSEETNGEKSNNENK